jgi:hypothetical protein
LCNKKIKEDERERGRNYSRRVDKVKNNGKSERHFIVGREEEHSFC